MDYEWSDPAGCLTGIMKIRGPGQDVNEQMKQVRRQNASVMLR